MSFCTMKMEPYIKPNWPYSGSRKEERGGARIVEYLRLTGKCHATDRDAAKDAVPPNVNDLVQPLAREEAVFEGGEHHLWWRGEQEGYRSSHKDRTEGGRGQREGQWWCCDKTLRLTMKSAWRSCNLFKGIVHPKIKILSSFTHLHIIPKVHDFILAWNTLWTMCWSLFSNAQIKRYQSIIKVTHTTIQKFWVGKIFL